METQMIRAQLPTIQTPEKPGQVVYRDYPVSDLFWAVGAIVVFVAAVRVIENFIKRTRRSNAKH